MKAKNAIYAQSGGVTSVINTTACAVIETARKSKKINKLYAGKDGIVGILNEDLIDTNLEDLKEIKKLNLNIDVEVLIPDFLGETEAIDLIIEAGPEVINHNIETIKRLYKLNQNTGSNKKRSVRPQANYERSLKLLSYVKEQSKIITKSGIMIGLSESIDEIEQCIDDLSSVKCNIINIGQYLQPTLDHINVSKYYSLEEFEYLKNYALNRKSVLSVDSGPMVRSSYHAERQLKKCKEALGN